MTSINRPRRVLHWRIFTDIKFESHGLFVFTRHFPWGNDFAWHHSRQISSVTKLDNKRPSLFELPGFEKSKKKGKSRRIPCIVLFCTWSPLWNRVNRFRTKSAALNNDKKVVRILLDSSPDDYRRFIASHDPVSAVLAHSGRKRGPHMKYRKKRQTCGVVSENTRVRYSFRNFETKLWSPHYFLEQTECDLRRCWRFVSEKIQINSGANLLCISLSLLYSWGPRTR